MKTVSYENLVFSLPMRTDVDFDDDNEVVFVKSNKALYTLLGNYIKMVNNIILEEEKELYPIPCILPIKVSLSKYDVKELALIANTIKIYENRGVHILCNQEELRKILIRCPLYKNKDFEMRYVYINTSGMKKKAVKMVIAGLKYIMYDKKYITIRNVIHDSEFHSVYDYETKTIWCYANSEFLFRNDVMSTPIVGVWSEFMKPYYKINMMKRIKGAPFKYTGVTLHVYPIKDKNVKIMPIGIMTKAGEKPANKKVKKDILKYISEKSKTSYKNLLALCDISIDLIKSSVELYDIVRYIVQALNRAIDNNDSSEIPFRTDRSYESMMKYTEGIREEISEKIVYLLDKLLDEGKIVDRDVRLYYDANSDHFVENKDGCVEEDDIVDDDEE